MRYRDGPLVLTDFTAKINSNEKIGLAGRTGCSYFPSDLNMKFAFFKSFSSDLHMKFAFFLKSIFFSFTYEIKGSGKSSLMVRESCHNFTRTYPKPVTTYPKLGCAVSYRPISIRKYIHRRC